MNLQENYKRLRIEAYAGMRKRESSGSWIRMLKTTPLILGKERGTLLLAVNTGMRILDDIADGDCPLPPDTSPVKYLQDKQAFIRNPQNPQDELDYLFTYCYELANNAGLKIHNELNAFFEYFLFDARRRGSGDIFPQAKLDQAYDACDITGTIRGSLMAFGDDPEKASLLMPLGKAVRTYYTLRDYEADIAVGYVNIPKEAVERYGISKADLPDRFSPPVRSWFHEEAALGLERIKKHHEVMKSEKFRWVGRLALPIAYTRPASSYLKAVLADQK